MNITISAQGFELSRAIDQYVRARLQSALARIDEDVVAIDVHMKDTNGPRGGVDKQVLIRVRLRNRQQIALLTTHEDMYAAIGKGVKRTKRAVRRQTRKLRRFARQRVRDVLVDGSLATVPRH